MNEYPREEWYDVPYLWEHIEDGKIYKLIRMDENSLTFVHENKHRKIVSHISTTRSLIDNDKTLWFTRHFKPVEIKK